MAHSFNYYFTRNLKDFNNTKYPFMPMFAASLHRAKDLLGGLDHKISVTFKKPHFLMRTDLFKKYIIKISHQKKLIQEGGKAVNETLQSSTKNKPLF